MKVSEEDIRKCGWGDEYQEFQRKFDGLKRRIAKCPGIQRDLSTLKSANADPNVVLECLTNVVWNHAQEWRSDMRRQQTKMSRAAAMLRSTVETVESISKAPDCHPGYWMAILNRHSSLADLSQQMFVPSIVVNGMRAYEKYCRSVANMFGEILRKQAQLRRVEDLGILTSYVRHTTGSSFDAELARLLTDAYESIGLRKQFSADQLKKFRQRHLPKRDRRRSG